MHARFGALMYDDDEKGRLAAVDVRVGTYRFDSSEKPEDTMLFVPLEGFRPSKAVPMDDDPEAVRSTLWLLTDRLGLSADDAYSLSSVAVDFGVTQVVDGTVGCHGIIDTSIFG